jgi:hypothetical protein
MSELGFDWRGRSCPGVGVAIVNGAPSRSQLAASPLASGGLPTCPRLGALLEMPQLLLVVFIQHLHVAVGLTEFRKLFVVGLVASVEKVEFWIVELWERHAVLLSVKLSHKT